MINSFKIKEVIERLAAFCLVKGVQPDELVTAIFEGEYDSIETLKKDDGVYVIVSYNEFIDDDKHIIKMKYTYNIERQLQRIEQKINAKNYTVQWDREKKIDHIVLELSEQLRMSDNSHSAIKDMIPLELRGIVLPKLKLASWADTERISLAIN